MPGRERDFQTEKERDSNTHRNKSDGNLFGHRRKFHWKRPWATRALSSVTPQKNALLPIIFSFTTLTLYGRLSHAKKQLRTLKKKQRFLSLWKNNRTRFVCFLVIWPSRSPMMQIANLERVAMSFWVSFHGCPSPFGDLFLFGSFPTNFTFI